MAGSSPEPARRGPAWFGCVDLKYSEDGSVRVLELGDGHTSGFTGQGAFISQAFTRLGYTRRTLGPFMDTVLENKILTHDALVEANLTSLRPRAAVFRRKYVPGLFAEILTAVGSGGVVLKLADRQRGCGVVAVHSEDLDLTLQGLLTPPQRASEEPLQPSGGQPIAEWAKAARQAASLSGISEQASHWHANECPSFLAEELCKSKLVFGSGGHRFDGTLRVGFALEESSIRLLGAYWKLPDVAMDRPEADLSARVVSHTHGGCGTAACSKADEAAVWEVLEEPLLRVLTASSGMCSIPGLLKRYQDDDLFLAIVLTRVAAGQIEEDVTKAEKTLLLADQLASEGEEPLRGCACSYVRRTQGTLAARRNGNKRPTDWKAGAPFYDEAMESMPLNAAAMYFAGMVHLNLGNYSRAGELFARSVTADCDFACAYSQLATCCMLLGDFHACVEVSDALLSRHNRIAAAHYSIAVALYAQEAIANEEQSSDCDLERRHRAAAALRRAKELQRGKSWGAKDEEMLQALEGEDPLPKKPVRTWLFHAWRL